MKRLTVVLVLLLAACSAPCPPVQVAERDSLRTVIDSLARRAAAADSARRKQAGLMAGAEVTMLRYARIVARDPSQSVFLVGWTRRAFSDVVADTAR